MFNSKAALEIIPTDAVQAREFLLIRFGRTRFDPEALPEFHDHKVHPGHQELCDDLRAVMDKAARACPLTSHLCLCCIADGDPQRWGRFAPRKSWPGLEKTCSVK